MKTWSSLPTYRITRFLAPVLMAGTLILGTLLAALPAAAQDTLVGAGSTWKYLDNGSNQGTAWRASSFNDSSWAAGPAQLGYGDGGEATVVSYGPSSSSKYPTTYFRRTFSVADASAYGSLTLRVVRDDGAVVYLNGVEVWRSNMPASFDYQTYASSTIDGADESAWQLSSLSTANLQTGSNTLAVEIHQRSGSSSDISFDLELLGNTGSGNVLVTRGPYLQMGTPSAMTVRWRTDSATDSRVRYGTSAANLNQSTSSASTTTEHELRLTGLQAATRYYYAVGSTSEDFAGGNTFYFETPPAVGSTQATRLWVIGDAGTATTNQANVYNAYRNYAGSDYTHLMLMLGDNAYNDGTDSEYQAAVFDMYPEILRQTTVWSCLGNHDGYTADSASQTGPYYDIFTFPRNAESGGTASGTEAYYSFDYANAHFVVLDSYETDRSVGGDMLNWLEADLQATSAEWLIAFFHHPPYTKGSHDSDTESQLIDMRQNALPMLESYGVDLVLSGHSHSYERSYLIDGHYGKSNTFSSSMVIDGGSGDPAGDGAYDKPVGVVGNEGAVYVVAGSSGKISGGSLNHPAMYASINQLGSMILDLDGQTLDARFLNDQGAVIDRFRLLKGGGSCVITENPEVSCSDGQDNDCDGFFDCNDSSCSASPACAGNSAPTVSLSSPTSGSVVTQGDAVSLTGSASDAEDGDLSSSIVWTSSLDGSLGSGASLSVTSLSVGFHTLTATVTDSGSLSASDSVSLTVQSAGGNGMQSAAYSGSLGAPACQSLGSGCDSGTLLNSRGTLSPAEPNQPNTLDSCTDGTRGTYHDDESLDRLVVRTADGGNFAPGKTVIVEATVWAYGTGSDDRLDLYSAADAQSPSWSLIASLQPSAGGTQTLSAQFTLPSGGLQAVRGNFRWRGKQSPCSAGRYDDADDIVFAVGQ